MMLLKQLELVVLGRQLQFQIIKPKNKAIEVKRYFLEGRRGKGEEYNLVLERKKKGTFVKRGIL